MKMAIEKLKINYKTWTYQQNKNHKEPWTWITRPQTWHKKPKHMYLKFLTPLTVEKTVNL